MTVLEALRNRRAALSKLAMLQKPEEDRAGGVPGGEGEGYGGSRASEDDRALMAAEAEAKAAAAELEKAKEAEAARPDAEDVKKEPVDGETPSGESGTAQPEVPPEKVPEHETENM